MSLDQVIQISTSADAGYTDNLKLPEGLDGVKTFIFAKLSALPSEEEREIVKQVLNTVLAESAILYYLGAINPDSLYGKLLKGKDGTMERARRLSDNKLSAPSGLLRGSWVTVPTSSDRRGVIDFHRLILPDRNGVLYGSAASVVTIGNRLANKGDLLSIFDLSNR